MRNLIYFWNGQSVSTNPLFSQGKVGKKSQGRTTVFYFFSGWFPSADQPCRLLAPTFAPTTPSISKVKEIGHEPDDDGNVQSTANGKPLSQTASLYPKFPLTQHDKFRLTRGCAPASLAQMILQINIGCRWSSSVFATNSDQWQTPIWHENQWPVGCRTKKTDKDQRQPMFFAISFGLMSAPPAWEVR